MKLVSFFGLDGGELYVNTVAVESVEQVTVLGRRVVKVTLMSGRQVVLDAPIGSVLRWLKGREGKSAYDLDAPTPPLGNKRDAG